MSKISFVLPTVVRDFNLAEVSILSIIKLFNNADISGIYVIVPNNQITYASSFFVKYLQYITIIDENILQIGNNIHGWQKQQVIKLNICKIISTDFYIVLDSDCYLTKKISLSDIYINDKPIVALIEKHSNDWLLKSCAYFNINYENECPNMVMNVTPQILKTSIVKELIGCHDVGKLILNGCNEFWLYFCFLIKKYNFNDIYHVDENKQLQFGGCWVAENMKNNNIFEFINNQFDNEKVIFSLFQSNMNINRDYYLPIILHLINKKIQ